jgi:ubiquinone/menaquinone biosynthesis C-methylase UbiE
MPLFDHFSWLAPFYDRFAKPKEDNRFVDYAGLPTAGRLLDVGGGTGRVAYSLLGKASQLIVVDLSFEMLRQAIAKPGLLPANAYSEGLPFPDGSFDCVIMVDALHHVVNQVQTAQELWRVLRPGGRIVIEEPDIRTFLVRLVALGEKLLLMRSHFLNPSQIADLFPSPARVRVETEAYTAWIIVERSTLNG